MGVFQLILIDLSAQLAVYLPLFLPKEESKLSINEVCGVGESSASQSLSFRKVTNNSLE